MKKILVSQRVDEVAVHGERRDALDQKWPLLLEKLGIIGFPVPNNQTMIKNIIKVVDFDGVLLTGGESPVIYGGKAPERDATDALLIAYAISKGLPVIGICRGMQSILLYFGGSLKSTEGHIKTRHGIIGLYCNEVNSFHSLIPQEIPPDMTTIFQTKDGVVEGIRHRTMPITGIMWHPEREQIPNKCDLQFIRESLLLGD